MSKTTQFDLPLIAEGQAHKHITVNEALARLDAMAQLRLQSLTISTPPSGAADGDCYAIPTGPTDAWADHPGKLAIYANGGWVFAAPKIGWRAWVVDQNDDYRFDGSDWVANMAQSGLQVLEISHNITAGPTNDTIIEIPANCWVLSITHRVQNAVQSSDNTGWQLGHSGDALYWGSGKSASQGAAGIGYNSAGMAYFWGPTPLKLSLPSGRFISGSIDFQVYYFQMHYPV